MDRTHNLICPNCKTPLKAERRVRIGKKIACPKCKIAFTVRPEDAEKAELGADGAAVYCDVATRIVPEQDAVVEAVKRVARIGVFATSANVDH